MQTANKNSKKTVNASLKTTVKAGAKAQAASVPAAKVVKGGIEFNDGKQLYRIFRGIDAAEYDKQTKETKSQATICALRSGRYAESRDSVRGGEVMIATAGQGYAWIIGKRLVGVDAGSDAMQAGRFILSSKGLKGVQFFASVKALSDAIKAKGEKMETFNAKFKGMLGFVGEKYSILRASDGSIWRWEDNTNSKRGGQFYASTF